MGIFEGIRASNNMCTFVQVGHVLYKRTVGEGINALRKVADGVMDPNLLSNHSSVGLMSNPPEALVKEFEDFIAIDQLLESE